MLLMALYFTLLTRWRWPGRRCTTPHPVVSLVQQQNEKMKCVKVTCVLRPKPKYKVKFAFPPKS